MGLFGTRDGMIHRLSWRYLHSWWGIQIVGQNKRLGHFHVTIKKKMYKKMIASSEVRTHASLETWDFTLVKES